MDTINNRLQEIENRLTAIESKINIKQTSVQTPQTPKKPLSQPTPNPQFQVPHWFKDNWLVSIGVFLILIAMGWFISFAFGNKWIGEYGRLTLGLIGAASSFWLGYRQLTKRPKLGQSLVVLAKAITLLTLYAANQVYSLIPTYPTFFSMLAVVCFTAYIAISRNLRYVGLSAVFFASLIPTLLHVDRSNPEFLMAYVLLINGAALWMWVNRGWGGSIHVAFLTTLVYSFFLPNISNKLLANFFVWAFYLLFTLPFALSIYKKTLPALFLSGITLLFSLNFAFTIWIDNLTPHYWQAPSYFIAFSLLTALSYYLNKNWESIGENNKHKYVLTMLMSASALVFLFLTTDTLCRSILLKPAAVNTLLYFIEVSIAIAVSFFYLRSTLLTSWFSLFLAIPLFRINDSHILFAPFYSVDFLILLTATLALLHAAWINTKASNSYNSIQKFFPNILWALTAIFAMMLIWNICFQIAPRHLASCLALITYTIAAEFCLFHKESNKAFRFAGYAIIFFVLFRLFAVEVWRMPIGFRTMTFFAVGLLLTATALLDKKYKKVAASS